MKCAVKQYLIFQYVLSNPECAEWIIKGRLKGFQTTFYLHEEIIHRFCGCFEEIPCSHHRQIGKPRGIAQAQPISVHLPVIRKQFGGKF